jgi:hypothetical protein
MSSGPENFYERVKPHLSNDGDIPDYFVFYLTVEMGASHATPKSVRECYAKCDLASPSWLAPHFSNGLKSKPKRFIKQGGGYRLENKRREFIASTLGATASRVQTSVALNRLIPNIPEGPKREYLTESISCFDAGANRASIVMCWNLAIHHLHDHVLSEVGRLTAFNSVLALNKDRRVKISSVSKIEDFTEVPEGKFLEFCREAKLLTSSMFKKLNSKLDDRNGAAHPSGLKITQKFAEAYVEDLVENVMLKYSV